jgi:hypothetical protein
MRSLFASLFLTGGTYFLPSVVPLRIRDILKRIWIWILGFVHLITDQDPSVLGRGYQDANKNSVFFAHFLL